MIIDSAESRTEARPASFRWKAFGIHLAISLVVLGALLLVLFFFWFPGYLFDTDGGWQALRVIAGVDIILGPLLTLIAASPIKSRRELRKDFAVIGSIQILALSAGTWLAWDNRPYAMLWYDGMVYSLPWSALRDEKALPTIRSLGGNSAPYRVVVDLPFDVDARSAVMKAAVVSGTQPLLDPALYRNWPPPERMSSAFTKLALIMAGPDRAALDARLKAFSARSGNPVSLIPVRSRYATYFLAINASNGDVLGSISIPPSDALLAGLYAPRKLQEVLQQGAQTQK